jgi:hypothetical protein
MAPFEKILGGGTDAGFGAAGVGTGAIPEPAAPLLPAAKGFRFDPNFGSSL